ncbi:hypothetical protein BH10PSE12_BH10PSE12_03080 [soil metagenome]
MFTLIAILAIYGGGAFALGVILSMLDAYSARIQAALAYRPPAEPEWDQPRQTAKILPMRRDRR